MIERIFHPIGQGAFYTEQHKDFTIVYDCGNWRNSRKATGVVKQGLEKGIDVDILFISHFDFDHVCKIIDLKKHTKIKRVVLPLLHENEKTMLLNLYKILGYNDLVTLIKKPKEYFDNETAIVWVEPVSYNENSDEVEETIDINNIGKNKEIKIKSGTKIINISDKVDWIYIPYNFEQEDRKEELEKLFKNEKYANISNIQKKSNNTKDTLKIIEKDVSRTAKNGGKLLREIYDKLEGKINQNSMLVYSGPIEKNKSFIKEGYSNSIYFSKPVSYSNKVGCIYTGDANLYKIDLKNIFSIVWRNVGTIQIPHHGDLNSFNVELIKNQEKSLACPISVGKNNSYGHPSRELISNISKTGSFPISVTEDISSKYIELIDLTNTSYDIPNWIKYCVYEKNIDNIDRYEYYLKMLIRNTSIGKDKYKMSKSRKDLKELCAKVCVK